MKIECNIDKFESMAFPSFLPIRVKIILKTFCCNVDYNVIPVSSQRTLYDFYFTLHSLVEQMFHLKSFLVVNNFRRFRFACVCKIIKLFKTNPIGSRTVSHFSGQKSCKE